MKEYIATFHTHSGAIVGHRSLKQRNLEAHMMPVPRKLSSSCGTCVRYKSEEALTDIFELDLETVYEVGEDGKYSAVFIEEES